MNKTEALNTVKTNIHAATRLMTGPKNDKTLRAVATAAHNAFSQIPDKTILTLTTSPNARLRVQLLTPKNDRPNAKNAK